jgi:Concanavalin A-like lectin/glucanases superfamily
VANGSHSLTAVARDAAGNTSTSSAVPVTVQNSAPPPATGLVAAYGFEESSGPTTADASGNGHVGTLSGATRSTLGKNGSALSFDGNDLVTVADAPGLDLTTGMTLEAWVLPASGGGWRTVIMKERPGDLAYALYSSSTGSRPSGWLTTPSEHSVSGPGSITTGAWTHLALTYDGAALKLFVNGAQTASQPASGAITTSTQPLRFGGNSIWNNEWLSGRLDDIRIYNRALSAGEIQADMNRAVGS